MADEYQNPYQQPQADPYAAPQQSDQFAQPAAEQAAQPQVDPYATQQAYQAPQADPYTQTYQAPQADPYAAQQQAYQQPQPGAYPPPQGYPQQGGQVGMKSKMAAGLLAIFLGCLGIHKFYMGWTKEGVIMLLVSLLTCGIGAIVMEIIGIIEGIMYLTKTDMEFYQVYEIGGKTWF